jgi:hypothetical protein
MPRNIAITAVFTEPVSRTQTRLMRLLEGEREVPLEPASTSVANGVKMRPATPLRARTEYTIVVEGARDHAGNAMQGSVVRKFTTSDDIDVQPPTVAWRYGSILPTNVPAAVEFSEPVAPLTVEGRLRCGTGVNTTGPSRRQVLCSKTTGRLESIRERAPNRACSTRWS